MKKSNNYPENLVFDAKENVLKVSVSKVQETKSKKEVVTPKTTYIRRRYSFDDNGGGYQGL